MLNFINKTALQKMMNSQRQSDFDTEDERTEIAVWRYTNGVNKGGVQVAGITDKPI